MIWLPDCRAETVSRPFSRLPSARRSSGGSSPWSIALRTIWTSGSRIISIISRSSSTSLPSTCSVTDLPSSAAVSRTMRGKAENRASIFCMRVRVTVSRISATVSDSRSSAASTVGSAPSSRSRRASSLRASTMSDMPLIIRSSRSTFRRTLRVGLREATGTCAWVGIDAPSSSAVISMSSPLSSSGTPASIASTISPIRSTIASTALTSSVSGTRLPSRTAASTSSAAWLSRASRGRSRKPQLPFTVCTKRKIGIEPVAIVRRRLPCDDLARERLERLARLGDEFLKKIVHGPPGMRSGPWTGSG